MDKTDPTNRFIYVHGAGYGSWFFGVHTAGHSPAFRIKAVNTGQILSDVTMGGQLQLPVQGSGAGILLGTDVNLYRSAANVLGTGDTIGVIQGRSSKLGQLQHKRLSYNFVVGLTSLPVPWDTAFADTNYTVALALTCYAGSGPLEDLRLSGITGKTASSVSVCVRNSGIAAITAVIEATAIHE